MRYLKNTSWLFAEKIIKIVLGFVVIVLLTRHLGPEKFGVLSYSQSIIAIFFAIATLGVDVILVREIAKRPRLANVLVGTAVYLKILASIVAVSVIFLITMNLKDKEAVYLTNIISITLLFQSVNCIDSYFQAKVRSKFTVISNSVAFVVSSIVKLLLIYYEFEVEYFAYSLVFDAVIIAIGYTYVYRLHNKSLINLKFNRKVALFFLSKGWPLMLVSMAAFIYTRTDQLMIKHMLSNAHVGNYSAAIKISELFYFLPVMITQSIFPKLIEMKKKSEQEYLDLLEMIFRVLVWMAIPISLIMYIFSETIVSLLYGEEYMYASSVLNVMAFSVIFNVIGVVSTKILYAEGYEKKYLYRSLIGVLVNIFLNFWLINVFGIVGAAISTMITLFVLYYVYDLVDKDLHKFYYLKWKCFIPAFKL